MGKSANKKKKPASPAAFDPSSAAAPKMENVAAKKPAAPPSGPAPALGAGVVAAAGIPPASSSLPRVEHFAAVFLRRAHELKEEGNRRFQSKDYQGALDQYEQALRLTPRNHPDRAIFHSNRAACLMHMKPVQYETVVRECTLALEVHPRFSRALFRRARALEALGKLELALHDVQMIVQEDGNHQDALELAKRLRIALENREEAQQDMQGRPTATASLQASYAGTSPAALGASVVRGSPSPAATRGPSLPARPLSKRKVSKPEQPSLKVSSSDAKQVGLCISSSCSKEIPIQPQIMGNVTQTSSLKDALKAKVPSSNAAQSLDSGARGSSDKVSQRKTSKIQKQMALHSRSLKLIYDHDIRLARMPANCKFCDLRELVRKRFPSSKAVLIKYKDMDGDLITITSTEELRLAEAAASSDATSKNTKDAPLEGERDNSNGDILEVSSSVLVPLRLHVVEVSIEQEPVLEEEEFLDSVTLEETDQNMEHTSSSVGEGDPTTDSATLGQESSTVNSDRKIGKHENGEENSGKEIEIDEWLLDFAHLFRMHIGVEPDAHIDLHELGMEFCAEALEETVSSEEAQPLFEAAACKFQEVAALAFFNWGNVHMCAARKRIPLEESGDKGVFHERLRAAFDWAQSQYELARMKYDEALRVKPDFYESVLALGQESFESAKLRWSLAVASQVDLSSWDSSETVALFNNAEERMQVAAKMWEKLEERRLKEVMSPTGKRDALKLEAQGNKDSPQELSEAETREQFLAMRFQISLFWGNILFEHSQVEFKLGFPSWKTLLDAAVQKFELAGASPSDIVVVLKNHVANSACPHELKGPNAVLCEHMLGTQGNAEAQENAGGFASGDSPAAGHEINADENMAFKGDSIPHTMGNDSVLG